MGTRSRIGVMHGDVCKSVYCHYDGYLEHNGRILQEYYDSAKANHLVALGDLSTLGRKVDFPDGEFHTFSSPMENVTVFYNRDRGEEGTNFEVDHTFAEFFDRAHNCNAEYYYVMKDGEWFVGTTYSYGELAGKLIPLAEVLAKVDIEANETVEEAL